jgi:hypothetical protein
MAVDDRERQERARAALAGTGDPRPLAVSLRIAGGVHGERLELEFDVDGEGHVASRRLDELERRDERVDAMLDRERLAAFYGRFVDTGVLDRPQATPPFPADTVVGVVRVRYEDAVIHESYVVPDPEQLPERERSAAEPSAGVYQIITELTSELARRGALP